MHPRFRNLLKAMVLLMGAFMAFIFIQVSVAAEEYKLSEESGGQTIQMKKGDTLSVRLKAQPGTGYGWSVKTPDPPLLNQMGDMKRDPLGGMPGAYEYQVFLFGAQQEGTCVLELDYLRPWEKDKPPARVFRVTIQISGNK
jgi:inhibitor of cysteine peptidase